MRFLKASLVFDGNKFLEKDRVLVLDERQILKDIVAEETIDKNNIEFHEGILLPGFVNAHCHLELSHLKGKIPQHTGLPEFGKQVILKRDEISAEEKREHMKAADVSMWDCGIVAVGDISNGSDSFEQKVNSPIHYHTFVELIGLDPRRSKSVFDEGLKLQEQLRSLHLSASMAPHAPYSTSRQLISSISDYDQNHNLSFSIHNQESEEENKFFEGKPSQFQGLYKFLNLDISWFEAPGVSSLQAYAQALGEGPSLLVHNTVSTGGDIERVTGKNVFWCFCPGANLYIENRLPDFQVFEKYNHRICVGTDSLASNSELDLPQEINLILKATTVFSLEDLLTAITGTAANALKLEDKFGMFIKGKNAGLNLLRVHNSELQFIRKLA